MSKLIFKIPGARGREIAVYDNKCVITTNVTLGSLLTNNALDGEKTIFYIDVVGVQFKPSGMTLGYLQLETPSIQMNNQSSNMFSENTFTFEGVKLNDLMLQVRDYIIARIEGYKYGTIHQVPVEAPPSLLKLLESIPAPQPESSPTNYALLASGRWVCPSCGAGNADSKLKCYKCGKRRED